MIKLKNWDKLCPTDNIKTEERFFCWQYINMHTLSQSFPFNVSPEVIKQQDIEAIHLDFH